MSLLIHKTEPAIWGIWKIEESVDELLAMLSRRPEYIAFIEGKSVENRKKEWLAVRVLLKHLLGKEEIIHYYENGAPYLPESNYFLSISHTKGYVAVILHPHTPVGVDIEYRGERILKVRSKFMTPSEEKEISSENEVPHLLLHWCAKETLFKVVGESDVDFQEHLHIEPFAYNTSGVFFTYETRTPQQKRYQMSYLVTNEFVFTYTSPH